MPFHFSVYAGQLQEVNSMRQLVTLIFALDETTRVALEPFTANEFSQSATWARSILMYYGILYPPTYKLPGGGERNQKVRQLQNESLFDLYPNPAQKVVYIKWQGISGALDIQLIDSFGRILDAKKLEASGSTSVFVY